MNPTFGLGQMRLRELRSRMLARCETVMLVIALTHQAWVRGQRSRYLSPAVLFELRNREPGDLRSWLSRSVGEPMRHLG